MCVGAHTGHGTRHGGGTPSEGVSPPIKHPSDKDGQLVPVMGGGTLIWYPTGAFFMGYPTHERYRQSRGDGTGMDGRTRHICFFLFWWYFPLPPWGKVNFKLRPPQRGNELLNSLPTRRKDFACVANGFGNVFAMILNAFRMDLHGRWQAFFNHL